jgi:hypothetical protein
MKKGWQRRLPLLVCLCLLPALAFAWTGDGHKQAAILAAQRMTGPIGELLRKEEAALLRGSVAPDREFRDFLNHVYHPRDHYGGGMDACLVQLSKVQKLMSQKAKPSQIAFEMGVLSHYVADLHNPLHTSGGDPGESKYHSTYEQAAARDLASWQVPRKKPKLISDPKGLILGSVLVANKSYGGVSHAFTGGRGYSQVQAITRSLFAEAVHTIACLWLTAAQGKVPQLVNTGYLGNKNSKIFHRTSCPSAAKMAAKNKVSFSKREEAIAKGFRPCKNCRP